MRRGKVTPESLQPAVLCFGTFQNRDSGVGVFPKSEERLICSFRLGHVSQQSVQSTELQVRQCPDGIRSHETAMIENLLKFGRRFRIPVRGDESLAAHIGRVQTAKM